MNFKSRVLHPILILFLSLSGSRAAEFSQPEWNNPAQGGNTLLLSNRKPKTVAIKEVFLRDKGFKISEEVAFTVGPTRYYFTSEKAKRGQWTRLKTKEKRKIRIKPKEGLVVGGFEYGSLLKGKPSAKTLSREYVVELKLIDDSGDSTIVQISESTTKYYINGTADGAAPAGRE